MAQYISKRVAQQIVETVRDVCDHNINFIGTKGIIFASTDDARVGNFHEIGRQVVQTGQTIEVEHDEEFLGTHKGVNMPFVYKGEIIAVIGISGVPEEVRKYAYLAQKITYLILREHEMESQSSNRREQRNSVVRALVSGEHNHLDYLREFIDYYHGDLSKQYRTVLVSLDARYNPLNLSMIERHIYRIFEMTGSPFYGFQYPNEYVMILTEDQWNAYRHAFCGLAEEYKEILKIGIGSLGQLMRQSQSCLEARIALHSLGAEKNLALYDELDLEILLGSITPDVKNSFLSRTIETLEEKDRHLLEVYFDCDFSLKKTCEKLFVHKNTVQYQLDKIYRNCGYNPRNFKDAVILYLALRMR